jgi:hypothetical protein
MEKITKRELFLNTKYELLLLIINIIIIKSYYKMRSLILTHYCSGDQIEKNEMAGACSMCWALVNAVKILRVAYNAGNFFNI